MPDRVGPTRPKAAGASGATTEQKSEVYEFSRIYCNNPDDLRWIKRTWDELRWIDWETSSEYHLGSFTFFASIHQIFQANQSQTGFKDMEIHGNPGSPGQNLHNHISHQKPQFRQFHGSHGMVRGAGNVERNGWLTWTCLKSIKKKTRYYNLWYLWLCVDNILGYSWIWMDLASNRIQQLMFLVWMFELARTCPFREPFHWIPEHSRGHGCDTNSFSGRTKIDLRVNDLIFIGFQRFHHVSSMSFIHFHHAPSTSHQHISARTNRSTLWRTTTKKSQNHLTVLVWYHEHSSMIFYHQMGKPFKHPWFGEPRSLHRLKACRRCGTAIGSARVMQGHLNIFPYCGGEKNTTSSLRSASGFIVQPELHCSLSFGSRHWKGVEQSCFVI